MIVHIVPVDSDGGRYPTPTMGTKVLTVSGEAISGVSKIVLTADVEDVWRATIDTVAQPEAVWAEAEIIHHLPFWKRLLIRVAGVECWTEQQRHVAQLARAAPPSRSPTQAAPAARVGSNPPPPSVSKPPVPPSPPRPATPESGVRP